MLIYIILIGTIFILSLYYLFECVYFAQQFWQQQFHKNEVKSQNISNFV